MSDSTHDRTFSVRRVLLSERPTLALAILPAAIAVNFGVSYLVNTLKLPFFGDTWGTFFMGAFFGPGVGAVTGVATNVLGGFIVNPAMPWYVGTAAIVGIYAGYAARWGWLSGPLRAAAAGALLGVLTAIVSAPVTAFLFDGVSAAGAFSYFVALAVRSGERILNATIFAGLISDPFDKALTAFLVSLVILAIPRRLRLRFPELRRAAAREAAEDENADGE